MTTMQQAIWSAARPPPRIAADALSVVLEAARAGYYDHYMPPGETVLISESWLNLLGLTAAQVPPASRFRDWLTDRIHPDDRRQLSLQYDALLAGRCRSYSLDVRMRHAEGEWLWVNGTVRAVEFDERGKVQRIIGVIRNITTDRQREERSALTIQELNHRASNVFAIIQGLANQAMASAEAPQEALAAFIGRLEAIKTIQSYLYVDRPDSIDFSEIAERVAASTGGRIRCTGPSLPLPANLSITMAIALNELYTNALKYGALSTQDGRVDLKWQVSNEPRPSLHIDWQEAGGPVVRSPARRGFGLRMIENALRQELNGSVNLEFRPGGLVCRIFGPMPGEPARTA